MADPIAAMQGTSTCPDEYPCELEAETLTGLCRKEKRKAAKKLKRKQMRKEIALKELAEGEAQLNDPEEQLRIRLAEQEEAERMERERKEFEEREKRWMEAAAARKAEEEAQQKLFEESHRKQVEQEKELDEDENWEYADEGPAEIIWQGNEIIVKKKRIKVAKKTVDQPPDTELLLQVSIVHPLLSKKHLKLLRSKLQILELNKIKLTVHSTSRLGPAVLDHVAAECIFTLISHARCLSRTCTMVLALLGSKMRGLRSVRYCFCVAHANFTSTFMRGGSMCYPWLRYRRSSIYISCDTCPTSVVYELSWDS